VAKAGSALLVLGVGAVVGYGFYLALRELYTSPDVHLVFKVGPPVALVDAVLLVAAAVRDRVKDKGYERFEEVPH
jgi:hypothetical protein